MKKRLAVLAVVAAMTFGSTVGVAAACEPAPPEKCNNGVGNGPDCRPGKAHFNNDDGANQFPGPWPGRFIPGDPGARGGPQSGNAY